MSCIRAVGAYVDALKGRPHDWLAVPNMTERLLESWTAGETASSTSTEENPFPTSHGEETPLLSSRREGDSSEGEVIRPRKSEP